MTATPLVVRCELAAPVAGPHPYVHLDGLLAWAWIVLRGPRSQVVGHTSSDELEAKQVPLPLARQDGIYCASALWPVDEDVPQGQAAWRLRPALEYSHLMAARQVPVGHGPTRPYDERLAIYPQRVWEARCVADTGRSPSAARREVRRLLAMITAIGKKRSQGYGRVVSWTVEIDERGWEWQAWGGVARRPIPHPDGTLQGVIPPYWYRPWHRPALTPGEPMPTDGAAAG